MNRIWILPVLFMLAFSGGCIDQHIQETIMPVYTSYPACEAAKNHIKTRTIISGTACGNAGDSLTETYNPKGELVSMVFYRPGYDAANTIHHVFHYDSRKRLVSDSSYSNEKLYQYSNFNYSPAGKTLTIHKTPNWADSSETVFIRWKHHRIVNRIGVDRHGDTVYRYTRNGDTESELLYRRSGNEMKITERTISVNESSGRLRTTFYYSEASEFFVFRMEIEKYNSKGQLLRKETYDNDKNPDEICVWTYLPDGKIAEQTETVYHDNGSEVTSFRYSYTPDGKTASVKTEYSDSQSPGQTEISAYDSKGLLTEIRTENSSTGAVSKCIRFTYTYY